MDSIISDVTVFNAYMFYSITTSLQIALFL